MPTRSAHVAARQRGFTFIEIMMVIMILAIIATLGIGTFSRVEGAQRVRRAGREFVTALRYARAMSMSTGTVYGVQVDTTNKKFLVYNSNTPNTAIAMPMAKGGTYSLSYATNTETQGCTITPTPAVGGTGTTNYPYNAMGTCTTTGSISIAFGDTSVTVQIPAVGDPYLQ